MKKEFKFLTTVVSILIVSMLILAGCMHALSQNDSEPKAYDMDIVSETVAESKPEDITKEPPVAQNDMQKKFSDMSEISEDGRSITVITEEYLNNYWQENKNKQVALSAAEVLYIIQDSIKIYFEYDSLTVISNPTLESMHGNLIARYPLMNGTLTEFPFDKQDIDTNYVAACQRIHALIIYRLAALSSPDAFIFADEIIKLLNHTSPVMQSIFYVPADALTKDRDILADFIRGDLVDYEQIQIFDIFYYGDTRVIHYSGRTSLAVFPTAEMESSQANKVVDIIDRTEAADQMEEPFWEDDTFIYSFPCIQSQSVFALMYDGREILLVDALELGYITPEEFDNFDFLYYRSYKRTNVNTEETAPDSPYFRDIAVYTDKKRSDGIYPYANFVPDRTALTQYFNNIVQNDVYVINKGTHEIPSFTEIYESYDGPWFESNSLILAVIESDSNVLPKVSSIIVDGSTVEVYFDPESLGKKQDQVYTVFLETNKIDIENVNIFTEQPYSEHPLYEKYPEYFGLDGMKGVEVYVWQTEDGSYRCGALKGTNRMKTNEEIQALFENGATIEEMRTILEFCEVDKSDISVIPVSDPLESDWYQIDIDEIPKYQEIFWGE